MLDSQVPPEAAAPPPQAPPPQAPTPQAPRAVTALRNRAAAARAAGRSGARAAARALSGPSLTRAARVTWTWLKTRARALMRRSGLTDFGLSVVLLAAGGFLVGGLFAWRELTLIAVGVIAVMAVCVLYTMAHADVAAQLRLSDRRLRLVPDAIRSATAMVVITNSANRGLRPLRLLVPCGEDRWSPRTTSLRPGESWTGENVIPARRRGVIMVGPVSTVRADPLGLFRHERQVAPAEELIVHPRTVRLDPLGSGLLRDLEGQPTRTIVSHDLEFHALREYVPGDDRRHIHWRTSARTGRYMVRQFVDTRSSHLAIVVSGSRNDYADEDEFETALSVGASIASRASRDNQTVSVLAAGHTATRSAGARLLDPFSRAEWGSRRNPGLRAMIDTRLGRLRGVTVGILIGGSRLDARTVQQAGERLGAHVKLVGIRVGGQASRAVTGGELTMLNVARLEDLRRVLRALG